MFPHLDQRVVVGPGIGVDCAVVDMGSTLWVIKSDPITFATDQIGWYLVQVNTNDLATTGAVPRWLTITLLLPENSATDDLVNQIAGQVSQASLEKGITVIGGHTEITTGIDRPILMGTLIGEVQPANFIKPGNCSPGDRVLVTKSAAIEATALLARELPNQVLQVLDPQEVAEAANYLYRPGISVLEDAKIACTAGGVTAMHDPTEGGIATALWELAEASQHTLRIRPSTIPITPLTALICKHFKIDPLASISSGTLLIAAAPGAAGKVIEELQGAGIQCTDIGIIEEGPPLVIDEDSQDTGLLPRPARDEIARIFESQANPDFPSRQ